MEEANATWLENIQGVILILIEDLGAPTYSYVSCNVWVIHISFLHVGVEGEGISIPNLNLPTSVTDSSLISKLPNFINMMALKNLNQ